MKSEEKWVRRGSTFHDDTNPELRDLKPSDHNDPPKPRNPEPPVLRDLEPIASTGNPEPPVRRAWNPQLERSRDWVQEREKSGGDRGGSRLTWVTSVAQVAELQRGTWVNEIRLGLTGSGLGSPDLDFTHERS